MKAITTAVLMFSVAVTTWTQSTQAQESSAKPAPVEAFYCNLQDGKSMKDVMQIGKRFSKWADKNISDYSAWILTPQFGLGAELPQFIWLGSNPNGNAFGKGLDAYQKTGGDLQKEFESIMDCSAGHVLASSVEINAPDGPPGDGVVMFAQCSFADGSNWQKAAKAHKTFSGEMRAMGAKGSNWMFFPMLGGGNPEYDYLAVSTFKNWTDYGAAYEIYVTGGGWQKAMETYKGVTNCNQRPPTVWDVKLVRQGAS